MKQRTVLVTGASRGIGKEIAGIYASHGWRVLAPERKELDLSDIVSVELWAGDKNLEVDVLVNNAGENVIAEIEKTSAVDWTRSISVNLIAPVLISKAVVPWMKQRKWGRIVNVSSIFGLITRAGRGPYTAAKTGLIGFTRTAAVEWGAYNILVNAICPGYILTDLTRQNNSPEKLAELTRSLPLGRLGEPEEIARAVYFLGSEENTFITGQTLVADGGAVIQ